MRIDKHLKRKKTKFLVEAPVAFGFLSDGEEKKFAELHIRQKTGHRIADLIRA